MWMRITNQKRLVVPHISKASIKNYPLRELYWQTRLNMLIKLMMLDLSQRQVSVGQNTSLQWLSKRRYVSDQLFKSRDQVLMHCFIWYWVEIATDNKFKRLHMDNSKGCTSMTQKTLEMGMQYKNQLSIQQNLIVLPKFSTEQLLERPGQFFYMQTYQSNYMTCYKFMQHTRTM